MPDRNNNCNNNLRESVCIDVKRVYDCCKDRDCVADARVYFSAEDQAILDSAISVKPLSADIVFTFIDVEPMQFNRGFYTVDVRFFIRSSYDAYTGVNRPQRIEGLTVFDKKAILFGSEGNAKTYSSLYLENSYDIPLPVGSNMPIAAVEVLDPILLSTQLTDCTNNCCCCCCDVNTLPGNIINAFNGLVDPATGKRLYTTFGIFSIIRIMRNVQIIVPSYDFCIPEKECCGPAEDDPCSLFYKMCFPVEEFFPPKLSDFDNCNN